ncbi:hypothetical protein O181_004400 [Austropuccinia psidii MF-1]|uniref:Uncharacterized protein n=1 Tax=Austropuccinia psidii MF-1 TaxID=1389203 RepID=A0A9Q3BGW6_9BASI|nr:hypothetical protein [Austropuccinia psidii MF-1]
MLRSFGTISDPLHPGHPAEFGPGRSPQLPWGLWPLQPIPVPLSLPLLSGEFWPKWPFRPPCLLWPADRKSQSMGHILGSMDRKSWPAVCRPFWPHFNGEKWAISLAPQFLRAKITQNLKIGHLLNGPS